MRTTWVTLATALALNAADGVAASEYSELVVIYGVTSVPRGLPNGSMDCRIQVALVHKYR